MEIGFEVKEAAKMNEEKFTGKADVYDKYRPTYTAEKWETSAVPKATCFSETNILKALKIFPPTT